MKRIVLCLVVGIVGGILWWLSHPQQKPVPIPALVTPSAKLASPVYDRARIIVGMAKSLSATQTQIEVLRQDIQARTNTED